jgi:hypothetical protein
MKIPCCVFERRLSSTFSYLSVVCELKELFCWNRAGRARSARFDNLQNHCHRSAIKFGVFQTVYSKTAPPWPILEEIWPTLAPIGKNRAHLGPYLKKSGPPWLLLEKIWPTLAPIGKNLAHLGPFLAGKFINRN